MTMRQRLATLWEEKVDPNGIEMETENQRCRVMWMKKRTEKKMDFQFCDKLELPSCEDGQLSVRVEGLQTSLHCACQDPMVERKV